MKTNKENLPLDQILLEDSLQLLSNLPDECVDLVVSSPPYNLGKEYESRQALEIYLKEQTAVLLECSRILKNTGSLFWQVGAFSDRGMLIPLDIAVLSWVQYSNSSE
ncbi:MAG: DNA methyltransferase [Nostoc sp.]|uniref:DNA methyltransferase n=1 Tax=Nostoc sp. TaxID=1180 RepID=UPI002FFA4C22